MRKCIKLGKRQRKVPGSKKLLLSPSALEYRDGWLWPVRAQHQNNPTSISKYLERVKVNRLMLRADKVYDLIPAEYLPLIQQRGISFGFYTNPWNGSNFSKRFDIFDQLGDMIGNLLDREVVNFFNFHFASTKERLRIYEDTVRASFRGGEYEFNPDLFNEKINNVSRGHPEFIHPDKDGLAPDYRSIEDDTFRRKVIWSGMVDQPPIRIKMTGDPKKEMDLLNEHFGFPEVECPKRGGGTVKRRTPCGFVWHHVNFDPKNSTCEMQLVNVEYHGVKIYGKEAMKHVGPTALWRWCHGVFSNASYTWLDEIEEIIGIVD